MLAQSNLYNILLITSFDHEIKLKKKGFSALLTEVKCSKPLLMTNENTTGLEV